MSDQRYQFQSMLALKFLNSCRRLAGEKDAPPRMEQVIKLFGRELQADLLFLASLAEAKKPGERGHTIQPLAGLSFNKNAKGYGLLRGKGLGEITLPGLKYYENRPGKIPSALRGKKMTRYLVSERLRFYYAQAEARWPGRRAEDYCLVFAWKKDFSVPSVNEGQLYTTELISLISELAAYAINQIISENQYKFYIEELSVGSLATFLAAQKAVEPLQYPERRQERTNFASNWAVMDVVDQMRPQSIAALENFIDMNLKHKDPITSSAVLRVWEWLKWLAESEASQEANEKIQELKAKFEDQNKTEKKTLEEHLEHLKNIIINEYSTIMPAEPSNRQKEPADAQAR
jgi:hypothetical protein